MVTYSHLCNFNSVYEPACTVSGSHSAFQSRTHEDRRALGRLLVTLFKLGSH
jgi:hypothetical protein